MKKMLLTFNISWMILCLVFETTFSEKLSLNKWTYIMVDSSRKKWGDWEKPNWLRSFGLAMKDITGDGNQEIAAGRYIYRNPGGDMADPWQRIDFGLNVDAVIMVDVDGDQFGDIIAQAYPNVYWLEARDKFASKWEAARIATVPPTGHVNGQGYMLGQIIAGGKPEIILAAGDGIYCIQIPEQPLGDIWPTIRVVQNCMDEGIGVGDIDSDGKVDIVAGVEQENEKSFRIMWYKNPGDGSTDWKGALVSKETKVPDRIVVAELNGDNRIDVAVSEERYPGKEPDASLYWFEQPKNLQQKSWKKHLIITEFSLNNLDVADLDNDGDMDMVTNEHKGTAHKVQLFENDGKGKFLEHRIGRGTEMHLGARLSDLDKDGDLDMVGVPWDDYQFLHVWRNDAITKPVVVKWKKLTNMEGRQIPLANVGRQASQIILDIDKDGKDDIIVAGWSHPSMVWLRPTKDNWERYVIDDKHSHIEAGGAYWDIDGDGDLDILQGGSWVTNEVWWWENPFPNYDMETVWNRYLVKNYGQKQHHDQIFGDFDGDGRGELVFWNQRAQKLFISEIPHNPKVMKEWKFHEVWSWPKAFKYEGFAKADVNLDGIEDIIGGGNWFTYEGNMKFTAQQIDDYGMSRSAVGDFIKGGRPEIILGSGDGVAPLNLYEWKDNKWIKTTLIDTVDHGHTLDVADFNGDGNMDIYTAEMYRPGPGEDCIQWILYGDGKGHFKKQVLSIGSGTHEGKLGDVDGDGDIDIIQKDFQEHRKVDIWLNQLK
jgi:hypothetical protein